MRYIREIASRVNYRVLLLIYCEKKKRKKLVFFFSRPFVRFAFNDSRAFNTNCY